MVKKPFILIVLICFFVGLIIAELLLNIFKIHSENVIVDLFVLVGVTAGIVCGRFWKRKKNDNRSHA